MSDDTGSRDRFAGILFAAALLLPAAARADAIGVVNSEDLQKIVEQTVNASPVLLAKAKSVVAELGIGAPKKKKKKTAGK